MRKFMSRTPPWAVVLVASAAVAVAGCGSSAPSSSGTSSTASPAAVGPAGGGPGDGGPGGGTPVIGPAAAKAKAAALAKYPGRVEIIEKRTDGSYVVHVIKSAGGEVHVLLNAAFKITGTEAGGRPPAAPGS